MLAEITKMTTQLFISNLGFIFLFSRNINGLIDFLETFWLQSERALSEVRSSIQSCGFCEENGKKSWDVCKERTDSSSPQLFVTRIHNTVRLFCSMNRNISATKDCVCVDGRMRFVYGYMQKHMYLKENHIWMISIYEQKRLFRLPCPWSLCSQTHTHTHAYNTHTHNQGFFIPQPTFKPCLNCSSSPCRSELMDKLLWLSSSMLQIFHPLRGEWLLHSVKEWRKRSEMFLYAGRVTGSRWLISMETLCYSVPCVQRQELAGLLSW